MHAGLATGADCIDPISNDRMAPWLSGRRERIFVKGRAMSSEILRGHFPGKGLTGSPLFPREAYSQSFSPLAPQTLTLERDERNQWMNGITSVKWGKC